MLLQVLCVSPVEPSHDPALALRASSGQAVWRCMVGGKRVKPGMTLLIRNPTQPPEGDQAVRRYWQSCCALTLLLLTAAWILI